MKSNVKSIILFLAVILGFVLLAVFITGGATAKKNFVWSDVIDLFEDEKVTEFSLDSKGNLKLVYTENGKSVKVAYRVSNSEQIYELNEIAREQHRAGIIKSYDYKPNTTPWYISFLPYLLLAAGLIFLYVILYAQTLGKNGKINSFGRVKAKLGSNEKNPVKFTDVAGADEEKAELEETVEFLRDPAKFTKLGARIPRGVLLVGPPGTGKTLLAKAVAGEAGVPFYSISGSDFVEMYVGVGASRVRDLFETARRSPASIIFIDEIDAVGRHRGAGLGGGHDEREQTLNQLLVEMDGFGTHDGVIVMAATNRPDILDPALLRPGRFDRQITVNYPDLKGREEILKVHARNKPLASDVDLSRVSQVTVGFTGADLANVLNEAALLAARRGKHLIGMDEIEASILKVMVGTEKKNMKFTEEERRKTAYHEAGHAILAHVLPTQDPVRRISVVPSGSALGYTLNPPVRDRYSVYKKQLTEEISMLLGGRAAEEIIFSDISGGASNDIMRATQIARAMVTKYGMSDKLGNIHFGSEHDNDEVFLGRDFSSHSDYSDQTAATIDAEIKRFIDEAYAESLRLLRENIDKLHFIADFLVKYDVMDDEQFNAAMAGDQTAEEIAAMATDRQKKTEEENAARAEEERIRAEEEAKVKEDVAPADAPDAPDDEPKE